MSLGLVAKAKPMAITVGEEVLIPKDGLLSFALFQSSSLTYNVIYTGVGLFFGADGKSSQKSLLWHSPPEDIGERQ